MFFINVFFFRLTKKKSISISPISGQDQAKNSSSSTGDSVSSDNRNTKKGQNYAFAGEQQEGITANTTKTLQTWR